MSRTQRQTVSPNLPSCSACKQRVAAQVPDYLARAHPEQRRAVEAVDSPSWLLAVRRNQVKTRC
jgi:hypothetical protein